MDDGSTVTRDADDAPSDHGDRATPGRDREFGRDGWLLVAAIAVAFVVAPIVIYLDPPALPFVFSYLVLPLLPAVLLALLAVYVTTKP